jgi:hypothetical protein
VARCITGFANTLDDEIDAKGSRAGSIRNLWRHAQGYRHPTRLSRIDADVAGDVRL